MKKIFIILSVSILFLHFYLPVYSALTIKIRDIASIEGLKENQVYGFGLVVGLQGTGDSKSTLIQSSLKNLLKNLGFAEDGNIKSKNIAAVLLTAKLPPFIAIGDRIDITVSSIGDAKSLAGGILMQSPLRGADGNNYIVAQGPVSLKSASGRGRTVKTVALINNGGIVEREIIPEIINNNAITLLLKNWDFSVAKNIIKAVSRKFKSSKPTLIDGGKIRLTIPGNIDIVEYISDIENIEIEPTYEAKVVINESDGTIVMGKDVKLSEAVVSKDGMTVKINGGRNGAVAAINESSTVKDLVDSLNYLGVTTTDIISILKALKEAGALHANLVIM